jgi:ADP-ribosyl-[dinitrogen reductase] hydrolase
MIGFYHAEAKTAKERKQAVLNPDFTPFSDGTPIPLESPELTNIHKQQSYKEKKVAEIDTSGYVLATLEAALWALWHSETFEEVGREFLLDQEIEFSFALGIDAPASFGK